MARDLVNGKIAEMGLGLGMGVEINLRPARRSNGTKRIAHYLSM